MKSFTRFISLVWDFLSDLRAGVYSIFFLRDTLLVSSRDIRLETYLLIVRLRLYCSLTQMALPDLWICWLLSFTSK